MSALMRICSRWVAAFVLAGLPAAAVFGAEKPYLVDYLYVEANEGDSSGGHAALRFDSQTYHFQHADPGIIRIRRTDSAAFDYLYAMVGNRSIHQSRIAVSKQTYEQLRDALGRQLMVQEEQIRLRDRLHADVQLLEALHAHTASGGAAPLRLPVKALGYFLPDGDGSNGTGAASLSLARLKTAIIGRYGETVITAGKTQILQTIAAIAPVPADAIPPPEDEQYPLQQRHVAEEYDNLLAALFALRVLDEAPALRPGTLRSSSGRALELSAEEVRLLEQFAAGQEVRLVRLFGSDRPDWGTPFLIGMARLCAVSESVRTGRLTVLDLSVRPVSELRPGRPELLQSLLAEREEVFRSRRSEFFDSPSPSEVEYGRLERAANLLLDIRAAAAAGVLPPAVPESPFPSLPAYRSDVPVPKLDAAVLKAWLQGAGEAERQYSDRLLDRYAYSLFNRNCVTEIFNAINRAFLPGPMEASPGAESRAERASTARLGGFIEGTSGLTFIPFVSADQVDACYNVVEKRRRPSHRSEMLARMREREPATLVFLRECNTLTSTIYHPSPDDSPFLFFTDDTLLLRPVFGVFNLTVAAGSSLLGLLTLPVEGPQRLTSGISGMLFSLPELAFINLRKGSMPYAPEARKGPGNMRARPDQAKGVPEGAWQP